MWMPGLQKLSSGAVLHRFSRTFEQIATNNEAYIAFDEMEDVSRRNGVQVVPLCSNDLKLSKVIFEALKERGYRRRCEIGLIANLRLPGSCPTGLTLHAVSNEQDWREKFQLHESSAEGPDGYDNHAKLWVEMERRKCATEKMKMYLFRRDNDNCFVGSVGVIIQDGICRMKNVVIAPMYRRQGYGLRMVQLVRSMAEKSGCRLGCFAVEGKPGESLYHKAGLYPVTQQYEWSRRL